MDLRVKKTLMAIKQAYIEEKKRNDTVKDIKVTDICRRAMINKTTFYKHYCDIMDLEDKIETETVAEILDKCEHKFKIFDDTELFVSEVNEVFMKNKETINLIFDSRMNVFLKKLEILLIDFYIEQNRCQEEILLIKFCIGGAINVLAKEFNDTSKNNVIKFITDLGKMYDNKI